MQTTTAQIITDNNTVIDFLPLQGTDYVEFYVGNAKQAAHFYKTAFGFQSLAYAGPETGVKDKVSYVIRQNKLTFVLTTPLRTDNEIAEHIYKHGDGVKILALKVEDATSAWEETTKRGGKSYLTPTTLKDDNGEVVLSGIHTYGETVHLFVERKNYTGPFMPGFREWKSNYNPISIAHYFTHQCRVFGRNIFIIKSQNIAEAHYVFIKFYPGVHLIPAYIAHTMIHIQQARICRIVIALPFSKTRHKHTIVIFSFYK